MKTIRIKLCGNFDVVLCKDASDVELTAEEIEKYEFIEELEEAGLTEETDGFFYMSEYDSLTWADVTDGDDEECSNETPITETGESIFVWDYLKDSQLHTPFVFQHADSTYGEFEFFIELKDEEEFDPKKLQLIWAGLEVHVVNASYVADCIVYDGKKIIIGGDYPEFDNFAVSSCCLYNDEYEID